jgi:hypothetical protein
MRQKPRTVVAVLPDGREYFADVDDIFSERAVAEEAVRKVGLTTPRFDPRPVKVQMYELYTQDGSQRRRQIVGFEVTPPLAAMTADEYRQEMDAAIALLPEECRPYVQSAAWERASGNEEAVSCANGMVADLLPAIDAYTKRITKKK